MSEILDYFHYLLTDPRTRKRKRRYDRIAKQQHNWRRSIKNNHKRRGKHKILYDLEQTKSRLRSQVNGIYERSYFTRSHQGLLCIIKYRVYTDYHH